MIGKHNHSLVLIDVGNTTTSLTLALGDDLMTPAFMPTPNLSMEALTGLFQAVLTTAARDVGKVFGVAISNVCPAWSDLLLAWTQHMFGLRPWSIGEAAARARWIAPEVARHEVGEDLIANTVGAGILYGTPLLVADMGTALTVQLVDAEGRMAGVAIAPGERLQMAALGGGTALLDATDFVVPKTLFGRDTPTALWGGIAGGLGGLVFLARAEAAALWGEMPQVIATGGNGAFLVTPQPWMPTPVADFYDPTILWHGLKHAFLKMNL